MVCLYSFSNRLDCYLVILRFCGKGELSTASLFEPKKLFSAELFPIVISPGPKRAVSVLCKLSGSMGTDSDGERLIVKVSCLDTFMPAELLMGLHIFSPGGD